MGTADLPDESLQTSPYSSPSPQLNRTLPPTLTSPFVVCFTDAAWQAGSKKAGCGWIFTDHRDAWLKQGTSTFNYTSSPLMAEALAVRTALLNALEAGYTRICIKSDCQALVAIISSKQHPADLHGITRDIEFLSLSFDCISFVFISRNLNSAADALAKSSLYSAPTNQFAWFGFHLYYSVFKKKKISICSPFLLNIFSKYILFVLVPTKYLSLDNVENFILCQDEQAQPIAYRSFAL